MKNYKFGFVFFLLGFLFFCSQTVVLAKDTWIRLQSKNFHLIGNASEKDIRKVATKLEQFRETFRILFKNVKFDAPIPTNVVVFKSASAYKPFKPKRADGKIDSFVAGYFMPGQDVNYITLSTEGEDTETYGTIFHEYVHFMLETNFGKTDIPPWFNEGLAEYYQTFEIEKDQIVKLGIFQQGHVNFLSQSQLMPLDTFFNLSNYALKHQGNHSRSIFYAQAWALIHYLLQSKDEVKRTGLDKFLFAVIKGVPAEKAFQDTFQMTYAQMEKELKKYAVQPNFQYQTYTFKNKLTFDTEMTVSPLSDADSNAYLGDLLYHTNRVDDAEPYLQKAVAADPNSSLANTALGMVKFRQRKYEDAKKYLEKAIQGDQKNYLAFYNYAYLLSNEGQDEFGYVSNFKPETVVKMREVLNRAVALNPSFIRSYDLIAYINLKSGEQLAETIEILKKALAAQPGNPQIILRIAEIYSRMEKFDEALQLAQKVSKTTDEDDVKSRADSLINWIESSNRIKAQNEASRKQYEEAMKEAAKNGGRVVLNQRQGSTQRQPTAEEIAKAREREMLISINHAIKKPAENEKQIIGRITKITCAGKTITYSVKTETGTVTLFSNGFQNLQLVAFADGAENAQIGCHANLSEFNKVLTYQIVKTPASKHLGELVAIDFVPKDFRFVDEAEVAALNTFNQAAAENTNIDAVNPNTPTFNESNPSEPTVRDKPVMIGEDENPDEVRRKLMMEALKREIREPQAGEKRELGIIEKIECDNKGMYFVMKTETQLLKLNAPQNLQIRSFVPDAGGTQFGCGLKQFDVTAVFIYKVETKPKAKVQGDLLSIDFVPKTFKLEN
jgi:tetratricopeptide (TPR) repeat protein